MLKTAQVVMMALMFIPLALACNEVQSQALFKIERNKNANIVQYDARVDTDGKLHEKEPVVAYWVRHAEQGQVEELSWVQKTFAYGFDADLGKDRRMVALDLAADIGRTITVRQDAGRYRAAADIDRKAAWISKIFIHATGKGMSTKVDYIDMHGDGVDGGGARYERIVP